jgi:hypothetical protein
MKIETKCQGSEFEKFDAVMRGLIAVPKSEIAEKRKKTKSRKKKKRGGSKT